MDRNKIKSYAPAARQDFIKAITERAAILGLSEKKIEPAQVQGDVIMIAGRAFPVDLVQQRSKLEKSFNLHGFEQVIERIAYTWFNRFLALRYMEIHGFLDHGYRVLSNRSGRPMPELLENAEKIKLPGLSHDTIIDLKLRGDKDAELYRMLLVAQCNQLHKSMPFLFEEIDDESELLLPDNLLHTDSLIRKLVNEIPEEDWQEVEIIGWIYQFYISEKKAQVIGKVVKSEDIPAATQLFTPNWIVKYMVQNSLGRKWLATYPDSNLRSKMEYYIEPAEQTREVQAKLAEITPNSLDPEKITLLDPACGSGHILVEAYDIFKEIYLERGYRTRDIPRLILEKNLFGLDIDDRAAQLAGFALLMKARSDDNRILDAPPKLNVISIQSSEDLNASDIANHLYEYDSQIDRKAIIELISLFKLGKTAGSLIRIPDNISRNFPVIGKVVREGLHSENMFIREAAESLNPIINQAILLSSKYDCVVANPPYMGNKAMNGELKEFTSSRYSDAKSDLFAMFIQRNGELTVESGFTTMITMQSWMFLSTFKKVRTNLLANQTIFSLIHLGPRAFEEISGEVVQTCAFTIMNEKLSGYRPVFYRLVDESSEGKRLKLMNKENAFSDVFQTDFHKIPGSRIAYEASKRFLEIFEKATPLGAIAEPRQGLATADNDRFLRLWHEVNLDKVFFNCPDATTARDSKRKWFPYNKGGEFRKWYGNNDYLVNWENDGEEMKGFRPRAVIRNERYYFKPGITWTDVSSSYFGARFKDRGFLFDVSGSSLFPPDILTYRYISYMLSCLTPKVIAILNPTLHAQVGDIASLPIFRTVLESTNSKTDELAFEAINIARIDWNSFETSWHFSIFSWLSPPLRAHTTEQSWRNWETHLKNQIKRMMELETENNRLWIEAYGLQDELDPEVTEDQITLARPDAEKDVKRLISYAIGCMMGRYSLDEPGLIYATSGNMGFDPTRYTTFAADEDGILPITDMDWFPDDVANQFVEFISTVWPKEDLEENLKFIADSLSGKKNPDARDTIRKYLSSSFFKDHLQTYKNRPIYWLFSSGKQKAFECLVYLHRYNEATLSRMRSDYVIPLQGKLNGRIALLERDLNEGSQKQSAKVRKEIEALKKKQTELASFDDRLRHYADMKISLDLDDGVKVNYGKFGDLLAEVGKVTGKK